MPVGEEVFADKLNAAFKEMHDKNMYNQMLVYIEACHSGSLFKGLLPEDLKIYVTTAARDD